MATTFDTLRRIERRETDRLGAHLARLDANGWLEQSYCAEWRVYQVISHLASGARIFLSNLAHWFDGAPAMTQEQMQGIWAEHDALQPGQVLDAFQSATRDYLALLEAMPSDAGLREVDSFIGKVPAQRIVAFRLHELVLHSWDVLVARDRSARIPDDALDLVFPVQLQIRTMRMPAALAGKRVRLRTPGGEWQQLLDFRSEKPVVAADPSIEADISAEAPAEEICRLLSGRHFLPGSSPRLTWQGGSYQDLVALNIFGS